MRFYRERPVNRQDNAIFDLQPDKLPIWRLVHGGLVWTILFTALFFIFGADVLNGFVDLMRGLGAK